MNASSDRLSCPVSSSTAMFALRLDDGKVLKFDSVGNIRAASELKTRQKWTKDLAENKPVHAKVDGLQNGDTITVTDIH